MLRAPLYQAGNLNMVQSFKPNKARFVIQKVTIDNRNVTDTESWDLCNGFNEFFTAVDLLVKTE